MAYAIPSPWAPLVRNPWWGTTGRVNMQLSGIGSGSPRSSSFVGVGGALAAHATRKAGNTRLCSLNNQAQDVRVCVWIA